MSQNIANFFKPKSAAGSSSETKKSEKKTEPAAVPDDSASRVDAKPATLAKSPIKKSEDSVTPPTSRKRIRQTDSDASDSDDKSEPNEAATASIPDANSAPSSRDQSKQKLTEDLPTQQSEHPVSNVAKSKSNSISESDDAKLSKVDVKVPKPTSTKPASGKADNAKQSGSSKREDEDEDSDNDDDEEEDSTSHEAVLKTVLDFDARKDSTWKSNEPVPYSHLATAFEKIEATSKRLEITAILTKALRSIIELSPNDLLPTIYLCVNKLAPAHEGVELGLGDMVLTKALAEATGRQEKDIKAEYEKVSVS